VTAFTVKEIPSYAVQDTALVPPLTGSLSIAEANTKVGGDDDEMLESDDECDEAEVVVLDDTEMSVGGSSGDESRSRSSSGGTSSSSCGSRVSRKRAAEDSPERDRGEPPRQRLSGTITGGASGCWIWTAATAAKGGEVGVTTGAGETTVPVDETTVDAGLSVHKSATTTLPLSVVSPDSSALPDMPSSNPATLRLGASTEMDTASTIVVPSRNQARPETEY